MSHSMWRLVSALYAHRVGVSENKSNNNQKNSCTNEQNDDKHSTSLKVDKSTNSLQTPAGSVEKYNPEKHQRKTSEQPLHSPSQHYEEEEEELWEQIVNSEMYSIARDVVEFYSIDDKVAFFHEISNTITLLRRSQDDKSCNIVENEYSVLDLASMISTCTAVVCKLMSSEEHADKIEEWQSVLFGLMTMGNSKNNELNNELNHVYKCIAFIKCVCYHLATLIFTRVKMRSRSENVDDNNILQHLLRHFMEVVYNNSKQEEEELQSQNECNKELIILEVFTELTYLFINDNNSVSNNKNRINEGSKCDCSTSNINILIEASLQIMEKSVVESNDKSTHVSKKVYDGKDERVNLITALAKCVLMPLFNAISKNDENTGKSEVPIENWQTRLHKILRSLVPHNWLLPVCEREEEEELEEEELECSCQENESLQKEYKEKSQRGVDDSTNHNKHIVEKSGDDFIILVAALFDVLFTPQPELTHDNFKWKELSATSSQDITTLHVERAQLGYRCCDYLWQILLHSLRQSILYNTNGEGDMNGAHWNTIQLRVVYLLKRIVDNTMNLTNNVNISKSILHNCQAKDGNKGKLKTATRDEENKNKSNKSNTKMKQNNFVTNEHGQMRSSSNNNECNTTGSMEFYVYHTYFVWLQGKSENAWETFFLIFETLNEYGWHMIEPIMPALDSLLKEYADDLQFNHTEHLHKSSTRVQITSINVVWLELLFLKMLHHNNLAIRKVALRRLWALPDNVIATFSLQFIFSDSFRAATPAKMCTDLDRAPLLTTTTTTISQRQLMSSESNQTKKPSNSATFFESNPFEGDEVNATPFIEPIIEAVESFYVRVFTKTLHSAEGRVHAFRLLLAATLPSPSRFTLTCLLRVMYTLIKELYKEAVMHSEACAWTWEMIMDNKVQHTIENLLRDALQDNIPFWLDVRCTGIMFTTLLYFHAIDFLHSDIINSQTSLSLSEHKQQRNLHKHTDTSHREEQQTCVGVCTCKRNESLWKLLCLCGPLGQAGVKSNLQVDGCAYIGNVGGAVDVAFLNVQVNKVSEEIDMLSKLHLRRGENSENITKDDNHRNCNSDNHINNIDDKERDVRKSTLTSFRDRLLQVDTLHMCTRVLLQEEQQYNQSLCEVHYRQVIKKSKFKHKKVTEELELQEFCDDIERCHNNLSNDNSTFKEHFFLIGSLMLPKQTSNELVTKIENCNITSTTNPKSSTKAKQELNDHISKTSASNALMLQYGEFTNPAQDVHEQQHYNCYNKYNTTLIKCICDDVMTCALRYQNRPYCNQHKLLNALSAFVELHFALFSEVRACDVNVAVHASTFYTMDRLNALMSFLQTYSLNALHQCWNNLFDQCNLVALTATVTAKKAMRYEVEENQQQTNATAKHLSKYKTEAEKKDEEEMWSLQQTEQWDVLTASVNAVIHIACVIYKANGKHPVINELSLLPFMQELVTLLHKMCTINSKTEFHDDNNTKSNYVIKTNSLANRSSSSSSMNATRIIQLARNNSRLLQCVFNGLIVQTEHTDTISPTDNGNNTTNISGNEEYYFTKECTNMSSVTSEDAIEMIEKLMQCTSVNSATSHNASTTQNALLLSQMVRGVYTSIYSLCQFVSFPSNYWKCEEKTREQELCEEKEEDKVKVEQLLSNVQEFALEEIEKCWSVNLTTVYVLMCWILSKLPITQNTHNVEQEKGVCTPEEEECYLNDNNNESQSLNGQLTIHTEAMINSMLAHIDDVSSLQHTRLLTWMHIGLQYASRTSPDFVMRKLTEMVNITSLKPPLSQEQKSLKTNKKESMKATEVLENDRELYFVSLTASLMLLSKPELEQWQRMCDFMLSLCVLCQCNHMEDEGETTLSTTEPLMQEWGDNFNEYYLPTVRLSSVGRALLLSTLLKCASMHSNWAVELTWKLIEMNLTHPLVIKSPCMPNSRAHRARIRIWQLLCALLPLLPHNEQYNVSSHSTHTSSVYDIFKRVVWECLPIINTGSVRRFMELYVIELLRRHSDWFTVVDEALSNYNLRAQVCGSYILISAHAILNCMKEAYTHISSSSSSFSSSEKEYEGENEMERRDTCSAMSNALLPRLIQQATSHQHLLRTISHVSLCKIAELRTMLNKNEKRHTTNDKSECTVPKEEEQQHELKNELSCAEKQIDALLEYIRDADEHTKFRTRHEAVLFYDTALALQPRHLFCYQRYEANNILHDSIPAASFERLALLGHELQSINALRLPFEWMVLTEHLTNLQFGILFNTFADFEHIPHTFHRTRHHVDYSPESVRMLRTDANTICSTTSLTLPTESVHESDTKDEESVDGSHSHQAENTLNVQRKVSAWWCSEVYNELHPRALHQQRQELVIVASLLENPVNVAGLFRCADIFAVNEIVIDDKRVLGHPHFIAAARSAELWVPWRSIAPRHLPHYFVQMKALGYTVIGVEQTARSVAIDHFRFSAKTVLVLGAEGQGIDASLLPYCDRCVEITQFGLIRSLNVHVTGAIAMYEYTKQHLMNKSA